MTRSQDAQASCDWVFVDIMEDQEVYYIDVLLPLHLPGTYTYRVPREMNNDVAVGKRVVVQFGAKSDKIRAAALHARAGGTSRTNRGRSRSAL